MNLPPEATHFFTNVQFELIPEISYTKLETLSQFSKNTGFNYIELREALIKVVWSKISGLKAIAYDKELTDQYQSEILIIDGMLQMEHERSVCEFIFYGKSSLDAMATFVNKRFNLGFNGGDIDFKKAKFRKKLIEANNSFGTILNTLSVWLEPNRGKSDSIISLRDFWIHQSNPWIIMVYPPSVKGSLPIPLALSKANIFQGEKWANEDFFNYHFQNLTNLFNHIIDTMVNLEGQSFDGEVKHSIDPVPFFPFEVSDKSGKVNIKEMAIGRITQNYLLNGIKI
ncbi:hypothetical protein GS399_00875 [Pedobacter sp. HMF7647]|uniref:Uncharacterized protein n=1 Tax=Hufsiella arboris TaxID=2695275 RepID=A0A7K1Y5X5_9SPHI|nr:hypothetical protein [Hufsiella arboris]MXV49509.1 hypothetical protein [Hufsiella arboris]